MMNHKKLPYLVLSLLSLFSTNCLVSADKLFGTSNPKAKIKYNSLTKSFEAEAGTDFKGKLDIEANKETGNATVHLEVDSSASPVVTAEGERIKFMESIRFAEMQMWIKINEQNTQLINNLIPLLIPLLNKPDGSSPTNGSTNGTDANSIQQLIDALLPLLEKSEKNP